LQNEGYDLDIQGGFLLVRGIPYVTAQRVVRLGILISKINLSGDVAQKPDNHVCYWIGEHPCHAGGVKITSIENGSAPPALAPGVSANFTFSAKADYRDYHHKMTTYIGRITGEAVLIDPNATARTFPPIPAEEEGSVFTYVDTATSRAGIGSVTEKLANLRIGVVGLGGTGSYVLDFLAKTSVAEIHLFDGDVFSQHNAFRSPGAPSVEELREKPKKVTRFRNLYSAMHRKIVAHDTFLDSTNVALLDDINFDFVFICMDAGTAKRAVVTQLSARGIPFVDVGMGILLDDGRLSGLVRTTLSTSDTRDAAAAHISFDDSNGEQNEYASNIQIAELNALNAALAIIRFKKFFDVYRDARKDVYAGYSIAGGEIVVEAPSEPNLMA
jgi:hypothetical protein